MNCEIEVLQKLYFSICLHLNRNVIHIIATVIDNERHETLREGLLQLLMTVRPIDGPPLTIRVDAATGFQALVNDKIPKNHQITLEIGRQKNRNKNPIAERLVQEIQGEILHQDPTGNPISPLQLITAVNR